MRVVASGPARGSLKWIRRAVNDCTTDFDRLVATACRLPMRARIHWVSPLAPDEYAEYRDDQFLDKLKIALPARPLGNFWPRLGPQWDALGRTETGEILLVEAKANIPELVSSATAATGASEQRIEESLAEVKAYLGVDSAIPWSGRLYQYANRIAHLYLLRTLNDVPAHLIFVYFVGDQDVEGPETIAEWQAALSVVKRVLGIPKRSALSRYIIELFVDIRTLQPK